jgi:hypothetical protein
MNTEDGIEIVLTPLQLVFNCTNGFNYGLY